MKEYVTLTDAGRCLDVTQLYLLQNSSQKDAVHACKVAISVPLSPTCISGHSRPPVHHDSSRELHHMDRSVQDLPAVKKRAGQVATALPIAAHVLKLV